MFRRTLPLKVHILKLSAPRDKPIYPVLSTSQQYDTNDDGFACLLDSTTIANATSCDVKLSGPLLSTMLITYIFSSFKPFTAMLVQFDEQVTDSR